MSESKESRRAAIRHVSQRDGVSYGVASAKLDGLGKKGRKRLYKYLGLRWSRPKRKSVTPIATQGEAK